MLNLLSDKFKSKKLKIAFFGIGKSNTGVIDYLLRHGIDFELTIRSDTDVKQFPRASRIFSGACALCDIDEDIIFLSPSVRRDRPELVAAERCGTLLSSDAEFFFALSKQRIFAVTGSDGKSTTTYLISELLRSAGTYAEPAGNYGVSLTSLLDSECDVVAELSSFQLMYTAPKSFTSVITNIVPNHLNWHKSLDEYSTAKKNILKNAKRVVGDYDSVLLRPIVCENRPFALISTTLSYEELVRAADSENYLTISSDTVFLNGTPYFSVANAKRKEEYNLKNYMLSAAATLGLASGEDIERTIGSFSGLPHRAELVDVRDGISYINSSIDSSPIRTLKTLSSLNGNVAVIISGIGKRLPIAELAQSLPTLTVGAVFMGEIGRELIEYINENNIRYEYKTAEDMTDAVKKAKSFLSGGGTVILSPAATSFDKYKNFEERGLDFKKAVTKS